MEFQVVFRGALDCALVKEAAALACDTSLPPVEREHLGYAVQRGVFTARALRTLKECRASGGASSTGGAGELHVELRAQGATPTLLPTREVTEGGGDAAAQVALRREAWREEMRARAEHRAYHRLTLNVRGDGGGGGGRGGGRGARAGSSTGGDDLPPPPDAVPSSSSGMSSYKSQVSVGGSLLFTLISAVALGYYGGRMAFGKDSPVLWVLALACGIGTLMVEGALLVIRLSKQDASAQAALEQAARAGRGVGRGGRRGPPSLAHVLATGMLDGKPVGAREASVATAVLDGGALPPTGALHPVVEEGGSGFASTAEGEGGEGAPSAVRRRVGGGGRAGDVDMDALRAIAASAGVAVSAPPPRGGTGRG